MSMPRVGSSRIRMSGSVNSQRERTTFCWLPPERYLICVAMLGVLIESASTYFAVSSLRFFERRNPIFPV